jgi:indolepyruvate ferredoxin oxidoreductase
MFDPFGYAHVRRVERDLRGEYVDVVSRLAAELDHDTYDRAVEIASLSDIVRGYEDIKIASIETYRGRLRALGIVT